MLFRTIILIFAALFSALPDVVGQSAVLTEDIGTESDVRNGSDYSIVITITGDTLNADIGTNPTATSDFLAGMTGGSQAWNDLVAALPASAVVLTEADSVATITISQETGYYIVADETIGFTIPGGSLKSGSPISVTGNIQISNVQPSLSFGGTLANGEPESDMRTEENELSLTLSDNLWQSDITTDPLALSSIKGMFSGAPEFGDLVAALSGSDLELTGGGTILTIKFDADPAFELTADELVNVDVPTDILEYPEAFVSSTTSFTIADEDPEITIGGSFTGISDEGDLRSGGYLLEITVNYGSWATDVDTDPLKTEALINGLSSSPGSIGFGALVSDILGADQGLSSVNRSGDIVTIAIPQKIDFDISEDIQLSISVPANSFLSSSGPVTASNFVTIAELTPYLTITSDPFPLNESNLDGSELIVTVYEDEFISSGFSASAFTLLDNPNIPSLTVVNGFTRVSDTQLRITLDYNNQDIDDNSTLGLQVNASQFLGSSSLSSTNTVTVIAEIEPVVTGVSIPDEIMGANQEVIVTIYVEDAGSLEFSLAQGSIAGEPVYELTKSNNTTYLAKFLVLPTTTEYSSTADIPVTSLQLMNGSVQGVIYTGVISQDNDPIDVTPPMINLINFNNGTYKAGDEITATISAEETGLTFNSSTHINQVFIGSPRLTGIEVGEGIYQLVYQVSEGDDDVPAPGPVDVVVALTDLAGNTGTYSTISGTSPIIDANSPVITSMGVTSSGVLTSDDLLEISISAVEPDLSLAPGSNVNNVYLSSGRLSLSGGTGGIYSLIYDIEASDNDVEAGSLTADILLRDQAGNVSNEFSILDNTSAVSIVNTGPDGFIYGGGAICDGDSARIFLSIDGEGPFDVTVYRNGSFYRFFDDISGAHDFYTTPPATGSYNFTIFALTDALGNSGNSEGTAEIYVNAIPSVAFTAPDRAIFQVNEDSIPLAANRSGSVFSGNGVVGTNNIFSPKLAGIDGSPHVLYCEWTDPSTGCTGMATKVVEVLNEQADIVEQGTTSFPGILCFSDPNLAVEGTNTGGSPGLFSLKMEVFNEDNKERIYVDVEYGLIDSDPLDDFVYVVPGELKDGTYQIVYTYNLLGKIFATSRTFLLEKVPQVEYLSAPEDSVCRHWDPVVLAANLDDPELDYSFTGSGVRPSPAGFTFYPDSASIANNKIVYTFESAFGCPARDSIYVRVFDVPDIAFTPDDICIPNDGGQIGFVNETDREVLVEKWRWNFDDGFSEDPDTVTFTAKTNPVFNYSGPGNRTVTLEILTYDGCTRSAQSTINFGDKPVADIRWISDCFVTDLPVTFINESGSGEEWLEDKDQVIDSAAFRLRIFNQSMELMDEIESIADAGNIDYSFNSTGVYHIEFSAVNELYCSDTLRTSLELKPTTSLSQDGYFEDFNSSSGFWTVDSAGQNSSWILEIPDFKGFEPESPDDIAWIVRNDTAQRSWLRSPCFDFRGLERPMIRMDILKSFEYNSDGAVLQFSLNSGEDWTTVGNIGEGINWYNSFDVRQKPGGGDGEGSSIGWSGNTSLEVDSAWINAAHDLDELVGEQSVIFGIFYATDGDINPLVGNEGFAVDNIYLGERSKRAVIEHFTNLKDANARTADRKVDNFVAANGDDVVSLQYHVSFPPEDKIYEMNPAPPSARSFYYGVTEIPKALMDGGTKAEHLFDFSPAEPDENLLKKLTLEDPVFDLEITYDDQSRGYTVCAEALKQLDFTKHILHIAMIEQAAVGFASSPNDTVRNAVLDMVPSAAGTYFNRAWNAGDTEEYTFGWKYTPLDGIADLMVVAFIQEYETGRVLQVASKDMSGEVTSTAITELSDWIVFPNPFTDRLVVRFPQGPANEGRLVLTDLSGRRVWQQPLHPGELTHEFTAGFLEQGVYIIQWIEGEEIKARSTLVKTR